MVLILEVRSLKYVSLGYLLCTLPPQAEILYLNRITESGLAAPWGTCLSIWGGRHKQPSVKGVACARLCVKSQVKSQFTGTWWHMGKPQDGGTLIIPVLQMKKLLLTGNRRMSKITQPESGELGWRTQVHWPHCWSQLGSLCPVLYDRPGAAAGGPSASGERPQRVSQHWLRSPVSSPFFGMRW